MSIFGIQFDGTSPPAALPEDVELIGFDRKKNAFNYYTIENGEWSFFGDSVDMIQPGAAEKLRCAQCHTGGGLIMKELNLPWVHWEGETSTPGATELVDKFVSLRERLGISSIMVGGIDELAPVVERLKGS